MNGINNIIKYGTKACIDELEHSRAFDDKSDALKFLEKNDYKNCLEFCIDSFNNERNWNSQFGGFAWAKIARSLLSLVNLKAGLKATIENKDLQGELQVMKDIIIELNIFDGLAHNTASIMKNVVDEETKEFEDQHFTTIQERHQNQYDKRKKVLNLLDSKELIDPMDVYKEIEPTLMESGDINRFKDFSTKLRSKKEYYEDTSEKVRIEKFFITVRKKLKQQLNSMQVNINNIKKYSKNINEDSCNAISNLAQNLILDIKEMCNTVYGILSNDNGLYSLDLDLDMLEEFILKDYLPIVNKCKNLFKLANQCIINLREHTQKFEKFCFDDLYEFILEEKDVQEVESLTQLIIDDSNKGYFIFETF